MWLITTFDFRPLSDGLAPSLELWSEDVRLSNRVDNMNLALDPAPLDICICGDPQCSYEAVLIRRVEQGVLVLPPFLEHSDTQGERGEWGTPAWMQARGAVLLNQDMWATLASEVHVGLRYGEVTRLSRWEVSRWMRWRAPAGVLGDAMLRHPPAFNSDLFLGADEIASGRVEDALVALLCEWEGSQRAVRMTPRQPQDRPVVLCIDDPNGYDWSPLIHRDGQLFLHHEGWVFE